MDRTWFPFPLCEGHSNEILVQIPCNAHSLAVVKFAASGLPVPDEHFLMKLLSDAALFDEDGHKGDYIIEVINFILKATNRHAPENPTLSTVFKI